MKSKKDIAFDKIFEDFEQLANLVLAQLDKLEELIATNETSFSQEVIGKLVENERELDKLEVKLSDRITNAIALYQPLASDIRKLMSCYRIVISLERIGDMSIQILESVQGITKQNIYVEFADVIGNILSQNASMVKKAVLAYVNDDRDYAVWTIKNYAVADELNQKMLKKAIKKSNDSDKNKGLILSFLNMTKIVSHIDRIAHQAMNIAEAAIYSIEGKDIRHKSNIK